MKDSRVLKSTDDETDITILITCYNEENYIVDTIENVISALDEVGVTYDILVIDDVSSDNSVQRIEKYLRDHPHLPVHLNVNERNRGLANNYVDGAFLGKGRYYRLCCGDDPETRESLVHVFRNIGKADMILPYQDQKAVAGKSGGRKMLSRTFTFLINTLSGYKIKYYNGSAIQLRYNVMRWHPNSFGFGFQADMVTRLLDEGVTYMQVRTLEAIDRKGGDSSALKIRNILSVWHSILEILIRRVRRCLYGDRSLRAREIPNSSDD